MFIKVETDVLIAGSGPAGLQAAIYASRRNLKVTVLGKIQQSSLNRTNIENLSCIDGVMAGAKLLEYSKKKAEVTGAIFIEEDIIEIQKPEGFKVRTESGREINAKALVIATGIRRDRLNVTGEREYIGRGVAYCADCDAPFFKDRKVAVVGCGSAAVNLEVMNNLRQQVTASGVEILEGSSLKEIKGDASVRGVVLKNGEILDVEGVLIELGARGTLELMMPLNVDIDEKMHIKVDRMQKTNIVGLYAAGDICGPPYQVAKALGEGCIAGINAAQYAREYQS